MGLFKSREEKILEKGEYSEIEQLLLEGNPVAVEWLNKNEGLQRMPEYVIPAIVAGWFVPNPQYRLDELWRPSSEFKAKYPDWEYTYYKAYGLKHGLKHSGTEELYARVVQDTEYMAKYVAVHTLECLHPLASFGVGQPSTSHYYLKSEEVNKIIMVMVKEYPQNLIKDLNRKTDYSGIPLPYLNSIIPALRVLILDNLNNPEIQEFINSDELPAELKETVKQAKALDAYEKGLMKKEEMETSWFLSDEFGQRFLKAAGKRLEVIIDKVQTPEKREEAKLKAEEQLKKLAVFVANKKAEALKIKEEELERERQKAEEEEEAKRLATEQEQAKIEQERLAELQRKIEADNEVIDGMEDL